MMRVVAWRSTAALWSCRWFTAMSICGQSGLVVLADLTHFPYGCCWRDRYRQFKVPSRITESVSLKLNRFETFLFRNCRASVWRNGRALDAGPKNPEFDARSDQLVFASGEKNAHWGEPSPLFTLRALDCTNEYLVFAPGEETAA